MENYKERVEISCFTKMSEMKGISSVREYIDEAKKRGWKAIGITDINSTQAFNEAHEYLKRDEENELKLIYGVKAKFINEEKNTTNDITILIKEQKGIKNLYTILSNAFCNESGGEILIHRSQLDKYREGLLYGACEIKENIDEIKFYDFIQIEPLNREINKKIIEHGEKNNILVIASSKPLFVNKDDAICSEILNYSKGIKPCEVDNERYLYTTEEMLEKFNYLDKELAKKIVIDNTNILADMCEEINPNGIWKFEINYPKIENSKEILKELCYKKVHNIYGEEIPEQVEERLALELNSIIENGYETIYLIARDCVKKSNELGYPVGSRGCVGNSLVAFLLGITDFNPIDYNLPFEMFAGNFFDKEPDIDLNFSAEVTQKIYEYIAEKYGKDRIIYCGTIGTIAERTAEQMIKKYTEDLGCEIDENRKKELIYKLAGIKRRTGIHPGGFFILPENKDINEYTPIEFYKFNDKSIVKTHMEYHDIWRSRLYKFDILSHDTPTILKRLQDITKIDYKEINLNDRETLATFLNCGDENYEISTKGIPEFGSKFMINMVKDTKPKNFNDLVCLVGLAHGTETWFYNAEYLIKNDNIPIQMVISNRDDVMNFLIDKGIEKEIAFEIAELIRKGKASSTRKTYSTEKWNKYKEILIKHDIPEWYIRSCEKIKYLFPKAHTISYTRDALRIAWYKVHYPEAFYKVYFEVKGCIDINKYTNKKQIERKINYLKELDETVHDFKHSDEINDLEILLEMYNRGIIQDKKRETDDYDLINSIAIGEYCREIGHKFNTEELAVLVYRNKRMTIYEKIAKYIDLINNYPDMEVIERFNCKHYVSVKDMISNEIERLDELDGKLREKEDGVVYYAEMFDACTRKWERQWSAIDSLTTSFKDIDREVEGFIDEYNETLAYRISKRYLNGNHPTITAEYQVIDNQRVLTNIYEFDNNFLDIDSIFVNIPTPFKKGDLLTAWNDTPYRKGILANNKDVFVLDWLCTWRENINERLAKGNCDSSDMIGYGYYMYEDSDEFVCDHKWDYDSFEYYEGELKGIYRTLKAISSFIKNKISLELFVHVYEEFKVENRSSFLDWYNDEGLKLAGCSEEDILRYRGKKD